MQYWYELIHRPISLNTQPKGYVSEDLNHVNRNGFQYGAVAYSEPLTTKELYEYQLEPVHIDGLTEVSLITKEILAANRIRVTPEVLAYLIDTESIGTVKKDAWEYLDLDQLKEYADTNFKELKVIYKNLKKSS